MSSTAAGDLQAVQEFFDTLYGQCSSGFLGIWNVQDKNTHWVAVSELDDVIAYSNLMAKTKDVYFSISLQAAPLKTKERGKSETVICIPGVWAEVDYISGDAHSAEKLPPDAGAARTLINEMPLAPTIAVHSGNGFHAYWKFDKPFYFADDEEGRKRAYEVVKGWQRVMKDLAAENGWKVDSTFDLTRVYRVPGTFNRKSEPAKPVTIDLFSPTAWYPIEKVEQKIKEHEEAKKPSSEDKPKGKRGRPKKQENDADAAMIAEGCSWIRFCRDNPEALSEPGWHGMMTVIGRCQNGDQIVHEWSKPHPGYNQRDAQKKLDHAMRGPGPITCQYVRDSLDGEEHCDDCKFSGKIKSPIVLGEDQAGDLAKKYAYAIQLKRFIHLESKMKYDKEQFTDMYKSMSDKMAEKMLLSGTLEKVEQPTYWPGRELFVFDEDKRCLNMWLDDGVKPAPGDSSVFQEHIAFVIPDERERNHVLNFFAFMLQNPGLKIKHSIVIQGAQGIGKSYFLELFVRLIGKNAREINTEMLKADYNGWMENTQLVVIEELMGIGRRELVNKLKPLITSPRCPINEKFVASYTIPNRVNFLAFTNHEDALVIDEDDRRFFIYHSPATRREGDYYTRLFQDLEKNASAIKHWLLNRDIVNFKHEEPAPMTEAKMEVIEASKSPLEAWITERYEAEIEPFNCDIISISDVLEVLDPSRFKNITPHAVSKILKKLGGKQLGSTVLPDRRKSVTWAIRKPELYGQLKAEKGDAEIHKFMKPVKKEAF